MSSELDKRIDLALMPVARTDGDAAWPSPRDAAPRTPEVDRGATGSPSADRPSPFRAASRRTARRWTPDAEAGDDWCA